MSRARAGSYVEYALNEDTKTHRTSPCKKLLGLNAIAKSDSFTRLQMLASSPNPHRKTRTYLPEAFFASAFCSGT